MDADRMRRLTRELIAIDSVSGREAQVADCLAEELARRGWVVTRRQVDGERCNLLARFEEPVPQILFNTHLDTVPDQYGPEEDGERIYGRGACDTHGGLAAMLEALGEARERGVHGLGLLLVVGEEVDHRGARHAATDPALSAPDVLVVGEPTENRFLTGQKGILAGSVHAQGEEGHSGYPERFDSATEQLLAGLESLRGEPWLVGDSAAGNTVNVARLQSGAVLNQVPSEASAGLFFRLADPVATVAARAEQALLRGSPGLRVRWELESASDPVAGMDALEGHPQGVAAFNTDLPYFGWAPARRYLLGPGSILQAHRNPVAGDRMRGEWIEKSEQEEGAALYLELIEREWERMQEATG